MDVSSFLIGKSLQGNKDRKIDNSVTQTFFHISTENLFFILLRRSLSKIKNLKARTLKSLKVEGEVINTTAALFPFTDLVHFATLIRVNMYISTQIFKVEKLKNLLFLHLTF